MKQRLLIIIAMRGLFDGEPYLKNYELRLSNWFSSVLVLYD